MSRSLRKKKRPTYSSSCHASHGSGIMEGIGGMAARVCPYCNGTKPRPLSPKPWTNKLIINTCNKKSRRVIEFQTTADLLRLPIMQEIAAHKYFAFFSKNGHTLNTRTHKGYSWDEIGYLEYPDKVDLPEHWSREWEDICYQVRYGRDDE